MKRCRKCGSLRFYHRYLDWTPDGAMLAGDTARTRLTMLEADEILGILSGISKHIGFPMDRIAYRSEKETGHRAIAILIPEIFTRIPRRRLTRPPLFMGSVGRFVVSPYMAELGIGRVFMDRYRAGQWMTFHLLNPYSAPLQVGEGAGIFEYLERMGVDAEWRDEGDGIVSVEFRKASDTPLLDRRLSFEKPAYISGSAGQERCPACSVPVPITRDLAWDLEAGIISNAVTGAREVIMPGASFHAIMRELEHELGEEFPRLLEELERGFMRESSGEGRHLSGKAGFPDVLSGFLWRGVGNPVSVEEEDGGVVVVVENPFHSSLVAGRVIGLYEVWTGERAEASWTEEVPGRIRVSIRGGGG